MSIATARELARRWFQQAELSLPVDLDELLSWRGLALSTATDWPDRLCARYQPGSRRIEVNGKHLEVRRRFSIAHEVGHCALGHEQIDIDHGIAQIFGDEEESYKVVGDLEKEANAFAIELLVPGRWLRRNANGRSAAELVQFIRINCCVSEAAAWYRIMELKLAEFSPPRHRRR